MFVIEWKTYLGLMQVQHWLTKPMVLPGGACIWALRIAILIVSVHSALLYIVSVYVAFLLLN